MIHLIFLLLQYNSISILICPSLLVSCS